MLVKSQLTNFLRGTSRSLFKRANSEYSQPEEIRIPVDYGHIAGKAWGDPSGKPILGLHGWLDNANSLSGLATRLPSGYRFVCLDQPGHGKSSHYPRGMKYKLSDGFTMVKEVTEYLKWDKFIIVGHSLGGGISMWYSALFPEQVEKVVSIDLISFGSLSLQKHVAAARKSVESAVKIDAKLANTSTTPVYSFEDACGLAFTANAAVHGIGSITQESVEILMQRGLKEVEGGYTWAADLRLRIPTTFNMTQELVEEFASKISVPHLLIKGNSSNNYMSDENYNRILRVYRSHNPNFVYRVLEGGHHLHLNDPERVSPVLNEFLLHDFTSGDLGGDNVPFDMI